MSQDEEEIYLNKAPLSRRALAFLIDLFVFTVISVFAFSVFFYGAMLKMQASEKRFNALLPGESLEVLSDGPWTIYENIGVVLVLISLVYMLIKDGIKGAGFGKRWRKLVVVELDPFRTCKIGAAMQRSFLTSIFSIIEPFVILKSKDGRSLADKIAGTQVITKEQFLEIKKD